MFSIDGMFIAEQIIYFSELIFRMLISRFLLSYFPTLDKSLKAK